jgi:hypothetical protein
MMRIIVNYDNTGYDGYGYNDDGNNDNDDEWLR